MNTALTSAAAAIIIAALTHLLNKRKEREAAWRKKKLEYYEAFLRATSGISRGPKPPPTAKIDFANSVNNLHLIASQKVIDALHELCDGIAESNPYDLSREEHDEIWSRLVWHIRDDLGDAPSKPIGLFRARLWASGVGSNISS